MGFAKEVADYMIFMDEGKIVERAKTKEFFENPNQIELNFSKSNIITILVLVNFYFLKISY